MASEYFEAVCNSMETYSNVYEVSGSLTKLVEVMCRKPQKMILKFGHGCRVKVEIQRDLEFGLGGFIGSNVSGTVTLTDKNGHIKEKSSYKDDYDCVAGFSRTYTINAGDSIAITMFADHGLNTFFGTNVGKSRTRINVKEY
uniref:Uncharacterized protein n=1 Tax=Amphora coffeiformis TaxID=265554 RepID=A0A7S3L5R2_9STRA